MNNSLYHAVRPTFHFERIPTIFSKKDVLLDRLCSVSAPSRIFLVFATVAVLPAPVSHTAARMYTILLLDLRLLRSRMFHFLSRSHIGIFIRWLFGRHTLPYWQRYDESVSKIADLTIGTENNCCILHDSLFSIFVAFLPRRNLITSTVVLA